jgi:ubiquinone/menaquinone biosynthesis C-methylase UbiE
LRGGGVRRPVNKIVETYSQRAADYDDPRNLDSCWGRIAKLSLDFVKLDERHKTVADVGCGSGREIANLALRSPPDVSFFGVEPAAGLREIAAARVAKLPNVRILEGRFEALPLESSSVDYLYSVLAFHWTTDLKASVAELARVLGSSGDMDLTFIGKHNGREFIRKTSPIFFKYLKPARLIEAAALRKQLSVEEATALFRGAFDEAGLAVEESYHTFYDTLDGHWAWWVRIEGQLVDVAPDKKAECDAAVRAALATLETERGIPYTVHLLHVRLRR